MLSNGGLGETALPFAPNARTLSGLMFCAPASARAHHSKRSWLGRRFLLSEQELYGILLRITRQSGEMADTMDLKSIAQF